MPLFTPPQTPGVHHVSTGSTNSASGMTGVTRERTVSEASSNVAAGVKREGGGEDGGSGREKKRRIAPTPVGTDVEGSAGGAG